MEDLSNLSAACKICHICNEAFSTTVQCYLHCLEKHENEQEIRNEDLSLFASENANRSAIYTTKEKMLLTRLIRENDVVENKRTDGATIAEKNRAWESIATVYNSQPEINNPRTPRQLRKLWNNLKQRKRKETATLRHNMKMIKYDPVLESVDCPGKSTQSFVKEETESRGNLLECDDTPAPKERTLGNAGPSMLSSTNKSNDKLLVSVNAPVVETAKPLHGVSEVTEDSTGSTSLSTSTTKAVAAKAPALSEQELNINRLIEASQQQQELHDLNKRIAEETLLKVKEERKHAVRRAELSVRSAFCLKQAAALDLQRAADEAELASLKLKQFKKKMISEDS